MERKLVLNGMKEKFTPTVAYLGPEASFTHVAATYLFGTSGLIATTNDS